MPIPDPKTLKEFGRLFKEASEVTYKHDEFLLLIYMAAVRLHTGEWQAPDE